MSDYKQILDEALKKNHARTSFFWDIFNGEKEVFEFHRLIACNMHPENKKSIRIMEGCDLYFNYEFNKKEFGALIEALKALHNQMKD